MHVRLAQVITYTSKIVINRKKEMKENREQAFDNQISKLRLTKDLAERIGIYYFTWHLSNFLPLPSAPYETGLTTCDRIIWLLDFVSCWR